jgi:hypothetical protein
MAKKQVIGSAIFDALKRHSDLITQRAAIRSNAASAPPEWEPEADRSESGMADLTQRLSVWRFLQGVAEGVQVETALASEALGAAEAALAKVQAEGIAPLVASQAAAYDDLIDRLTSTAFLGREPDKEDVAFARFREIVCRDAKHRAAAMPDLHKCEQVVEACKAAFGKASAEELAVGQRVATAREEFMVDLTRIIEVRIAREAQIVKAFGIKDSKIESLKRAMEQGLLVGSDSLPAAEPVSAEPAPEAEAAEAASEG